MLPRHLKFHEIQYKIQSVKSQSPKPNVLNSPTSMANHVNLIINAYRTNHTPRVVLILFKILRVRYSVAHLLPNEEAVYMFEVGSPAAVVDT